jgi:mannose-1-phosphate guanylyltransferase
MLYAMIMAGGAGTRFWPASRKQTPKQLLKLAGDRSMIQSTVDRLSGLCPPENLLIVTNQILVDPISDQLPNIPKASIIGEPAKRDTAPCIGLAAAWVAAQDPDATMVVMPADHVISPAKVFQASLNQAVELVDADPTRIVTFGIKPTYPAEVFGYIESSGNAIQGASFPSFEVARFREKPDAKTAAEFLAAGTFYWNAGIFVWKARTILNALQKHQPEMFAHLQKIAATIGTDNFDATLQTEFTAIKGTSIDYAVMENYDNVLVVEAPFSWDDLGNWTAVPRQKGVDANGNTLIGRTLTVDTQGTLVYGDDDHLIVTVGLDDCIVVRTENATLIATKKDEAKIKQVVAELEKRDWKELL